MYSIKKSFWSNKRVLVTGHTGFKGNWISKWLEELGAEVFGYSLHPADDPNNKSFKFKTMINNNYGDVRDFECISNLICSVKPEIVFHLAAQPLVRQSYSEPLSTHSTNIIGTANILEACRRSQSVRTCINVTTDKCYENLNLDQGYSEDDKLGGRDPYSASKACSELVTKSYLESYFIDLGIGLATARAGNVIGGGDWSTDRLVPDVVRSLHAGNFPILRYPKSVRPWQHVLEPTAGYLLLAQHVFDEPLYYSGAWNFGPDVDSHKTVGYVTSRLCANWGKEVDWLEDEKDNLHEAEILKLDINKAKSELLWHPNWSIDFAIDQVFEWYFAWSKQEDCDAIAQAQLKSFSENLK